MAAARISILLFAAAMLSVCCCFSIKGRVAKAATFCKELECPKFKETYTSKDYSIRLYEPSAWVSTSILGVNFQEASELAFMKLFEYIQGENDQKVKIPMTVPVINSFLPGKGPVCATNFTFSFFVPFEFQKNTPKPTNSELFLSSLGPHKVFVRVYPGYSKDELIVKEAAALAAALNSSQPYDTSTYYNAGYDSPFILKGRHNEIWFFATDWGKK